MSLEQFLVADYTFKGSTLLLAILIVTSLSLALLMYIFSLRNKLFASGRRAYGFLGKPIYQFAALALVMGGMIFSVYSITSPESGISVTTPKLNITAEISHEILQKGKNYEVEFDVVPLLNNKKWGNDVRNKFDIYINIIGPTNTSVLMYQVNSDMGAKFTKILEPGDYKLVATIILDESTKQIIKEISLED